MDYRRGLWFIRMLIAVAAATLLGACNDTGNSGVAKGYLQIRMHDLPINGEDVEKVIVEIKGVEVHHAGNGWSTVPFEAKKYDLLELQNGTSVVILKTPLELGHYTEIRLNLNAGNEIVIGGQTHPLMVPSGENTGVKLITPFEITQGKVVEVTLDFNVQHSVKSAKEGYRLNPVIKVERIAEYDGADIVRPEGGYVSSIQGDFNVLVPPNAISGSVVFSINQVNPATLAGTLPADTILVGRVYDLEPEGYPFLAPVTLEVPYNEALIDKLGNEEDLYLATYNEQAGAWEPVPSIVVASANVVQAQVSHFSIYALTLKLPAPLIGTWTAEYQNGTVALKNDQIGRMMISENGSVRSITRTPVLTLASDAAQMPRRPTLFISICGANGETVEWDGDGTCEWQATLNSKIVNDATDYQFKHFAVDWDSHASNNAQVIDLAEVVKDFLRARQYEWDIVIVGHSRGGIFAHDLTRELVGFFKIKNMHTFLLDPTAAGVMNDFYPVKKWESSPTAHYGSLFYDNNVWTEIYASTGTTSDIDISGYTNYGRHDHVIADTSHAEIVGDWMSGTGAQGLAQAFSDFRTVKDSGAFDPDGDGAAMEYVRISRPADASFVGDIDLQDGNIHIWGELTVGNIPTTVDATFGPDGAQFGYAAGLAGGTQMVVTDDKIVASESVLLVSTYLSISAGEISSTVDLNILKIDLTFNDEGITWELEIADGVVSGNVPWEELAAGGGVPLPPLDSGDLPLPGL